MKKLIYLIIFALCFSGCAKAGETISQSGDAQSKTQATQTAARGNLVKCAMSTNEGRFAVGYSSDRPVLFYIDYATATETAVCSAPSCAHNAEGCTALLKEDQLANYVYTAGAGNLVVATYGKLSDEPCTIQLMDMDGSNKKELYVGKSGEALFEPLAIDDKNIYFRLEKAQGEATEILVYSVPLAGGEAQQAFTISRRETACIGISGRDFYFYEYDWSAADNRPRPLPPENATIEEVDKLFAEYDSQIIGKHNIHKINVDTGEKTPILDWTSQQGSSGKVMRMEGDTLYLSDNEKFTTMKGDGTQEVIAYNWPSPLKEKEQVTTIELIVNDKAIISLCDNSDGSVRRYCVDLKTGDANKLSLTYISNGREMPISIGGVSADSLLIQYDCRIENAVDFTQDGTAIDTFKVTNSYAMLSLDDFLQSKPNYKQIKTTFAKDLYGY